MYILHDYILTLVNIITIISFVIRCISLFRTTRASTSVLFARLPLQSSPLSDSGTSTGSPSKS